MKSKLAILALVLVCLSERARADSTATAEASINWAGATFSSPASPAPLANNTYSTIVQASGVVDFPNFDISIFKGGSTTDVGWAPTTFTELFSPGNVTTASTSANMVDALAMNTVGAVGTIMDAQAERSGAMTTLDGNIVISLPYTFTFTATNGQTCCSNTSAQVFIELWNGTNLLQGAGASDAVFGQSFSQSGTLVLDATGLSPGTYQFDVGAASGSTFVPEPGTLGLVGLGFAFLWRRLTTRQKADFSHCGGQLKSH